MQKKSFSIYAVFVLIFNLGVILWGAYVRASGSGAGCGSHWPLCNGEVLPRSPQLETLIEYAHRASSGISLALVVGLFIWGWRLFDSGHPARKGISLSLLFIVTEALVGAGLVLFGWVATDESVGRTVSIAVHLVNTFLLLAALALTVWWSFDKPGVRVQGQGITLWALAVGLIGVMLIGVTGAITALGDTLFPAESLSAGIAQDFSPNAHFLIRLRVWHPVIAVATGFYVFFTALLLGMSRPEQSTKRLAWVVALLFGVQLLAGVVNLVLLAPVFMQLVHLLLADLVWIALVLLSASALAQTPEMAAVREADEIGRDSSARQAVS